MSAPRTGPELRRRNLEALDGGSFDVLVIGGGINGAVSAAALSARGLKVALVDRGDIAAMTSQESSNLVWGGFKYLQTYELGLVWKLCTSRNQLMASYPTAIKEIGFLATLDRSSPFPAWLAGLGSVAYWGIGRFATKRPRWFAPSDLKAAEPVVNTETASAGLEYADAYLPDNDSRFVWSFVRSALDLGATAANYVEVRDLFRVDDRWQVDLVDVSTMSTNPDERASFTLDAAVVVNAAGPLVDPLNETAKVRTEHRIVYSKGIHLVVPSITDSDRVLAFFDDTQRLFYVIPMAHRSVIGTTDTRTDRVDEAVTDEERRFVLDQINARLDLDQPITTDDIVGERSGVRPLVVEVGDNRHNEIDWTKLSRKHVVEADTDRAMVSILGGKLTDCLNVGDEVVDAVNQVVAALPPSADPRPRMGTEQRWYGEPDDGDRRAFARRATALGLDRRPSVERAASMTEVLWRRHGTAAHRVLDAIEADPSQGEDVLADSDVLRAELPVYAEREMVVSLDDFLRRRTKLSLIHRADDLSADPGMPDVVAALGLTED
jgi:glycerol-3-phosphate dehydrogenase